MADYVSKLGTIAKCFVWDYWNLYINTSIKKQDWN